MASIQFFIRNKKKGTKVALRMYISRNNQPCTTTELLVNGKLWSEKKQRLKGADEYTTWVNNQLDDLHAYLIREYSMDYAKGIVTDTSWLNNKVDSFFSRPKKQGKTTSEMIDLFMEENPIIRGKKLKEDSLKAYGQLRNAIKEFKDVPPIKIDLVYHKGFLQFLTKKEYSPNTISKRFASLKSFLGKLEEHYGVTIHESVKSKAFFTPQEIEVDNVYLNEERIEIVRDLKLKSERLIKTQDNFILGLRTGLRVSDFLDLHDYNIQGEYIEVQTKKTDKKVVIPIHPDVKELLERNNGLPPVISDQEFNRSVKEICKLAGFNEKVFGSKLTKVNGAMRKVAGMYFFYELVSSHTCRRSFATNLYGKLPNLTIMQITGHKTEKNFLKYIKTTSKEHAQKLKEYWESNER